MMIHSRRLNHNFKSGACTHYTDQNNGHRAVIWSNINPEIDIFIKERIILRVKASLNVRSASDRGIIDFKI